MRARLRHVYKRAGLLKTDVGVVASILGLERTFAEEACDGVSFGIREEKPGYPDLPGRAASDVFDALTAW